MDSELYERARATIARDHGLSDKDARRLVGETAEQLHRDAAAMASEVGAFDPTQRARDDAGRFASNEGSRINELIRQAAGRTS